MGVPSPCLTPDGLQPSYLPWELPPGPMQNGIEQGAAEDLGHLIYFDIGKQDVGGWLSRYIWLPVSGAGF